MKENYLVSYETAVNLLRLGYNEPCEYYYYKSGSEICITRHIDGRLVTNREVLVTMVGREAVCAPCILDMLEWLQKEGFKLSVNKTEYYDNNNNYCSGYVCDIWDAECLLTSHGLVAYGDAHTMIDAIKGAIEEVVAYLCNKIIHLFECGDFYEAKGIQAELAARVLGITVAKRGEESVIGFPKHALSSYKSNLEGAGYKVVLNEF